MICQSRPALEMADVFRRFGPQLVDQHGASFSTAPWKTIGDIESCRTAALGGHKEVCDSCSHTGYAYNSCRNRHCPKCQGKARAKWMEKRAMELLPVPYLHVVFTLPQILARLALQNKKVMYDILFHATSETLLQVAANPKHLGARIGYFAVLHTWGQQLQHHPHLHCVVPGGGISMNGTRWVHCKRSRKTGKLFFLPVAVLSEVFRGKFVHHLRAAYKNGQLSFYGDFQSLRRPGEFERLLDTAVKHKWVVYAKRPFANPSCLLKYLARYTHRVAISNSRLLGIEGGKVVFRWKDYRNGDVQRMARLDGVTFLRRFLQHVLPRGLFRIRHCGIFCNRFRTASLARCRDLLGVKRELPESSTPPDEQQNSFSGEEPETDQRKTCPNCKQGNMVITERWERGQRKVDHCSLHRGIFIAFDTS